MSACAAQAQAPATVRLDYTHSGNALSDQYALERVLIEPLPWPGDTSRNLDDTNPGQNRVEVVGAKTGDLLYSRNFSTVFDEWRNHRRSEPHQPRLPGVGTLLQISTAGLSR